jgi:hypothetical protein
MLNNLNEVFILYELYEEKTKREPSLCLFLSVQYAAFGRGIEGVEVVDRIIPLTKIVRINAQLRKERTLYRYLSMLDNSSSWLEKVSFITDIGLDGYAFSFAYYCNITFVKTPREIPNNNDNNVPNKKYSAKSRSSICLNRVIDLAVTIKAIAE